MDTFPISSQFSLAFRSSFMLSLRNTYKVADILMMSLMLGINLKILVNALPISSVC